MSIPSHKPIYKSKSTNSVKRGKLIVADNGLPAIDDLIKGGFRKGELVVFVAKSDVGNPQFPTPHKPCSSKLSDMKINAAGGFVIAVISVIIFFAKLAEWIWCLLPDKCQAEHCRRMGVRGNENHVAGILMCDLCHFAHTWGRDASRK